MSVIGIGGGLLGGKGLSRKRILTACGLMLVLAAALVSQAAAQTARQNRITQSVTSGGIVTLAGTVHPLTARSTDMGPVNSQMKLGLTLNVSLSAAEQKELNALLEAQQDPKSAQYHQWLTQEQYGARFGLTDADLNTVKNWLTSQGFAVTGVAKSRNAIFFSGQVFQVETAFHTQMHYFQHEGKQHIANTTELRVPAALGGVLLNVRGLTSFRPKPHVQKRTTPAYTADTTNGMVNFLQPQDWATIYDVNAIYNAGYTGTGMHLGVVGQTYITPSDITNFRNASGLGAANVTYACIDPVASHCTGTAAISTEGDQSEADLDIQWSGGIAKNATVDFVYAPYEDACPSNNCNNPVSDPSTTLGYYDVFDALEHAVTSYTAANGKVLPVISMSYTDCEESFVGQSAYVQWVTDIGTQANSQGQTIVVASGDTGPFGCDSGNYPASQGVSVAVPDSSPNYTAVGGTTLNESGNPDAYWKNNDAQILGESALGYIPEEVWNDTALNVSAGQPEVSASGGGVSLYYAQPSWQPTPANYTGASGRFVPDVAFTASPDHDGYLTCSADNTSTTTGTDCSNGFLSTKDYWDIIGGTSASTPSFAGMLTLLVQRFGPLGNINLTLYGLAANATTYASVFHDVTNGSNITNCTVEASDTGCPNSGSYGFNAQVGYDLATGLGSIDGYQLYQALGGDLTGSTTTLAVSPTTPAINQSVTLTATVVSGSSSVTTTPTGTVTFTIDGTAGSPVTLVGGAAQTTMTFSTAGAHTVAISYSGDSTFSASSVSQTVTVTTVAAPTFTLTPSTTAITVGDSSSGPVTFTLGSSNYTGSVTLTATSSNPSLVVATLSSSTVSLANGTQQVTLTVSPGASAANHAPRLGWTGGIVVFGLLLGAPFTVRRKRALAVLLTALAISALGFTMACGGGGGSSSTPVKQARTYTVTVVATGTGTANPPPVYITVTVP